jgi:hypothetical protein
MVEFSKLKIFHDMTTNATFSTFFAHPKKRGTSTQAVNEVDALKN